MSATFLDATEIAELTGRKVKSKQIEALAKMGLPFFVNGIGRPVVTRVAVEGRMSAPVAKKAWTPRVLKAG